MTKIDIFSGFLGAGKTTLIKLICGLYTPSSGKSFVGGHEIDEYNREAYYSMISALFQTSYILPISIAENIAVCEKEGIDQAKLDAVIRLSGLTEKIQALPEKTDTPINKSIHANGIELSGGEAQKLLFARALYKDAPLLVLDEPTSALDPELTGEVLKVIRTLAEQKTTMIIVTHEMAFARDVADQLIFMDGGVIVEQGDPHQVIDNPKEERTKQFLTRYAQG